MSTQLIEGIIAEQGIVEGHFVYKAGKHGTVYLNKRRFGENTMLVFTLTKPIADNFTSHGIDIVVSPERGANVFGFQTASTMDGGDGHPKYFTALKNEKEDTFYLPDDQAARIEGKTILIVEDITTSGSSVDKVKTVLEGYQAKKILIAVIWNRGGDEVKELFKDNEFFASIDSEYPAYTLEECRESGLCSQGVPISTDLGHGEAFVAEHGQPA